MVNRNEVLDLDFLVHVAVNKDSWSVEVIAGLEGEMGQGTPCANPVPPDEDKVPSNPVPPDEDEGPSNPVPPDEDEVPSNPVPPDEDEVPSNPVPPDQQDAQQGVYDETTEESTEDDEDILWQTSKEKLAKVKG